MKKSFLFFLAFTLAAAPLFAANDFTKKKSNISTADAAPSAESSPAKKTVKPAKMDDHKKKLDELKKQLNGSEWEVQMSTGGKPTDKDTFTFQNGQVTCKTLKDRGYPPTNYTVSMPEGADMATWETMQTSPKGQVVFIRAEWLEGTMRGVMSEQLEEGKTKDYNFTSLSKVEVPATTEKPKEEKAQGAAETASTALTSGPETADVEPFAPGTTEEVGVKASKRS